MVDLPQSDAIFLKAYHAETAEALCDGHVMAFDFFGGVPQSILYDNTKPSSFGRFTAAFRRYPGGTENDNIFRTLSREMLKCRAASRWLMPSAHAKRTFRYMSTVMILQSSLPPAART